MQSPCSSWNALIKRSDTGDKRKHVQVVSCDSGQVRVMLQDTTVKVRGVEMTGGTLRSCAGLSRLAHTDGEMMVALSSLPSYTISEHRDELRGNGARDSPSPIGHWLLVMSLFQHSTGVALEIPGG